MIPSTSLPADPCWLLETSLIDLTDRKLCKNNTNDGSNMEIKTFNVLPLLSAPQMSSQYMIFDIPKYTGTLQYNIGHCVSGLFPIFHAGGSLWFLKGIL